MIRRIVFFGACAGSAVLSVCGGAEIYGLLHPARRGATRIHVPPVAIALARVQSRAAYDTALHAIIDRNLFRRDRSPAQERVQPIAAPLTPPVARPHVELRGLMGGPPWEVLLDGVPGHQSSVLMRVGQTIGGVTVTSVKEGTVLLKGADTVWHLTLRRQ
jgi:hypothetical protein